MSLPEIIASPLTIWIAPIGTSFPAIDEEPEAPWIKLGSNGDASYAEGGVTVQHSRQSETSRPAGPATAPTHSFTASDDLRISVELLDLTLEQYAVAMGMNAVTSVPAAPGQPGYRVMGLSLPARRNNTLALLARGPSPYVDWLNAQYEVPRCAEVGSPRLVFRRGSAAGLALEFMALADLAAANEEEIFGRLVAQTAPPQPPPATLGELSDVTVTSLEDGDDLAFDGTKWINQ